MSWNKLNNSELQAMRKLLMLDVSEASEFIGKVSNRTWQYWESGRNKVPDDVDMEMYALSQIRNELINRFIDLEAETHQTLKYYHTFERFVDDFPTKNKVDWRLHQSVCAFVFSDGNAEFLTEMECDESILSRYFSDRLDLYK